MTPKQERFAQEYLVDLNATQAAVRAGYSARTAASQGERLLRNVEVQAAVQAGRQAQGRRTLITADLVIAGLKAEATLSGEGSSHSARVQAWVALGKHLALFVDRHQHEGGLTLEVVEELVDAGPGATQAAKATDRPAPRRPAGVPPK